MCFFQLCCKHGFDWQAVRVLLVSSRPGRRAPQDVCFPPASLSPAAQHVQALFCCNWTVSVSFTLLPTLSISVISLPYSFLQVWWDCVTVSSQMSHKYPYKLGSELLKQRLWLHCNQPAGHFSQPASWLSCCYCQWRYASTWPSALSLTINLSLQCGGSPPTCATVTSTQKGSVAPLTEAEHTVTPRDISKTSPLKMKKAEHGGRLRQASMSDITIKFELD